MATSPRHHSNAPPEWADANCRAVLEAAPDAMLIVNRAGEILAANLQAEKLFGLSREQLIGTMVESLLPVRFRERHRQHRERFLANPETQFMQVPGMIGVRSDTSEFPADVNLSRLTVGSETLAISAIRDATERLRMEELKRSEAVLRESEERIARELHDDINQRLALLAIEIEASKQNPPNSAEDISRLLTDVRERITEVSCDVQSISHQLHSSQLEYLGIVGAMKSFCREFAARQKVEIDFTYDDIPRPVSREVSLCLFRVLQEALHNAVKHSHVRHFEVRLGCSEGQVELTVSDCGAGFDADTAMSKGGLGLTSMRERIRLVNGTIAIDSKVPGGTTIHVRVPFRSERLSEQAVG